MSRYFRNDRDERNRGEFSGGAPYDDYRQDANFGGDYARDPYAGGFGGDYARDDDRFGGTGARGDQYNTDRRPRDLAEARYGENDPMRPFGSLDPLRGSHRGRGPKGYRRSDERIAEEVNERLTDHHDIDATHVEVKVENGEVTLQGTVASRRAKRLAEDIADSVRGVVDVMNLLRVGRVEDDVRLGKASE